jgi:hypothetical protein
MLDIGAGTADRFLVERDGDEALLAGWLGAGHRKPFPLVPANVGTQGHSCSPSQ